MPKQSELDPGRIFERVSMGAGRCPRTCPAEVGEEEAKKKEESISNNGHNQRVDAGYSSLAALVVLQDRKVRKCVIM